MANPFPFVSGSVLLASELNSIGEASVAFTPTFSGYTRGNGTTIAFHMRVNKLVYVYVQETLGSTSAVTGSIVMTLPFTASSNISVMAPVARFNDTGSANFVGILNGTNTTSVTLFSLITSGTFAGLDVLSATSPFTWANTDLFRFTFVYEAA